MLAQARHAWLSTATLPWSAGHQTCYQKHVPCRKPAKRGHQPGSKLTPHVHHMETVYGDHMRESKGIPLGTPWGSHGHTMGAPMGMPWGPNRGPMGTHMGMAWGPHGHSNGPQLEIQGAQRVAKGEPTWNPMGIKWAPKVPNVDMYVQSTGNRIAMVCTQRLFRVFCGQEKPLRV